MTVTVCHRNKIDPCLRPFKNSLHDDFREDGSQLPERSTALLYHRGLVRKYDSERN